LRRHTAPWKAVLPKHTMRASAPGLLMFLSFMSSMSAATTDADVTPLTPPTCDSWVTIAVGANVTEGKRWEYGYPDFSAGSKKRVGTLACSSATQRTVRVGPFTSRPGGTYDITSGLFEGFFEGVGDRITSFTAMPITELGEPVGYPPLYVHHIHVGRLTDWYDEHWFTSHGDFSLGDDFGVGARSTRGYTTFLPDGHCFTVDCPVPFAVQAIIQDLRSVPSAPELSIFIEVKFGLALDGAELEPATLIWNEAPHGPFGYARFAVLQQPSMSWWTMRWPASGVMLPRAKLHSHYARHHRLFLIDGAPQELSLFESHVKEIAYVHESVAPTSAHETMLLLDLAHTEQTLSQLPNIICQDDATMPSYIEATLAGEPEAKLWARRRDFVCNPVALKKGRISTFVQLYRAVSSPDVDLYPMHTNTWFYVQMPGKAFSSDIKTVSYRYATNRTSSLLEPLQDEKFGSCEGGANRSALAAYVANNNAGLARAVTAHRTKDAVNHPAVSSAKSAAGSSVSVHNLIVVVAFMPVLFYAGRQLVRAGLRAAPARTLL
jgi:hypothetical protein